jgi:hypothetical protein
MKPISINFTDAQGKTTKTFTACKLKTGTMDLIFDIAEKAEAYESGKLGVSEARAFFRDLKAVMVDVFGRQFSYDELDAGVDFDELIRVFTDMCSGLTGQISKN